MVRKYIFLCLIFIILISIFGYRIGEDKKIILNIAGSSSVAPLIEAECKNYLRIKNIQVDVQSIGSSAGIKAALDGTAEIGMSSRNLTNEESKELNQYKIAIDCIAIIINPENSVKDLSNEEVLKIFKGEITNWKEVGGKNAPIVVISREEGSGSRGAFEEIIGLEEKNGNLKKSLLSKKAIITDGNGSVKQNIALKPNGIGYVSVGTVDESVRKLSINGLAPCIENIKNGRYLIVRPFILITKKEVQGDAKIFIDYLLSSEGQKIVEKNCYISIMDI